MLKKTNYLNGQKTHDLLQNRLTYYFTNGKIKAEGGYKYNEMDGEWRFYRETGQLWQVGNFIRGKRNGVWTRYDKNDVLEYQQVYKENKIVAPNNTSKKESQT